MAKAKNLETWGRGKARERYADGGAAPQGPPLTGSQLAREQEYYAKLNKQEREYREQTGRDREKGRLLPTPDENYSSRKEDY